jgi:hypothetical protein
MSLTSFSIVRFIGRYSALERGMQFGQSHEPRPVVAHLPAADLAALRAELVPAMAELDRDRAAHVARTDRSLTRGLGGAALAGLMLGWGLTGDILMGLFLGALGAVGALFFLFGWSRDGPRAAARAAILGPMARHLMGFHVDADAAIARSVLAELKLFQEIRKVTVDLCLTGQRDGRAVILSRIGLMFGTGKRKRGSQGDGLTYVMVEVALPATAASDTMTTVMSRDASTVSKAMQRLSHRQKPVPTGDADFDARYTVFGDVARMNPALRAGFTRLEAEARCGRTGLTEVPAGTGLRPWVVILPGRLVVLTPLTMFDGAFEPPPYWEPLDPDALIPAFASDLAVLNGYLNAALSLPLGDIA